MRILWLLWALGSATPAPPDELCALYAHRTAKSPLGEPTVGIGVLSAQVRIELIATAPVLAAVHEREVPTEIEISAGARVLIERAGVPEPGSKSRACPVPWRQELILFVDGMELGRADTLIKLRPADGDVAFEAPNVPFGMGYAWGGITRRRFRGEMWVTLGPTGLLDAINRLPTEALLRGVVPSEMPASAPAEALKAQAIAARNFVMTGVGHLHRNDPFDFCAEQHCQVYGGYGDETAATNRAVEATRGEVLYLGERPVHAKYSARCGGHTEDNEVAWAEAPDEALRGRPDVRDDTGGRLLPPLHPHVQAWCDAPGPRKPWHIERTAEELLVLLGPRGQKIAPLTDVRGEGRGPGGRLKKLIVTGERGQLVIVRELPIRRALGQLRSAAITLSTSHDDAGRLKSLVVRGVGFGHGVGMCQQGAVARARAGQSCGSILGHYYAGAQIRPVWTDSVRGCP